MEFHSYFFNTSNFDPRYLATTTTKTTATKTTTPPPPPPPPPPVVTPPPPPPAKNMTALMIQATNDATSEQIVIVLSFTCLFIIVAYVLYEVFQPLFKFEVYNQRTKAEYARRYNYEEY